MKRIYKVVTTEKMPDGYAIKLDGRILKTLARNIFLAPTPIIADAVMQEWAGQGDTIIPDTMPLTQIISTKIDRVRPERGAMTESLLKYLDTDLVCYRADHPAELAQKQADAWDPVLSWFSDKFEETLQTTTGLKALDQPLEIHRKVRVFVENLDEDRFTALQMVVPACGSVVLGLILLDGAITAEDLFKAVRVEETYKAGLYNEEKYGPDPLQAKKDESLSRDLMAVEKFLCLIED